MEFPRVVAIAGGVRRATSGWPRISPRTRSSTRCASGPATARPRNPGAWLTTVGKRKAVDLFRRNRTLEAEVRPTRPRAPQMCDAVTSPFGADPASPEEIDDDRLRLDLRVLPPGARRCPPEWPSRCAWSAVSRSPRSPGPTSCRRRRSPNASSGPRRRSPRPACPSRCPPDEDRAARLGAVLEVIYLIYNEGYSATAGDEWLRPELCARGPPAGPCAGRPRSRRSPRCTDWSRSWSSSRPACAPGRALPVRPSSCSTRTAAPGTGSSSPGARPPWPVPMR